MPLTMATTRHEPLPRLQLQDVDGLDLEDVADLEDVVDLEDAASDSGASTASSGGDDLHRKRKSDGLASKLEQQAARDALHEQLDHHLTSDFRSFVNTCIAFLGSGVLGLPFAFKKCGLLLGLVTLVSVAAVSVYAMLLIVRCKYRLKREGRVVKTYGDIGRFAMGGVGAALVNSAIVISQTGFCIAYLIFIASNVNKFLDISKEVVVSVCIPPLIGFSLLKHMKELAMVALVADVMNILGLAIVLQTDLTYMPLDHDRIEVFGVLSSVPFFFGVASYCFEGVGMVLPLENSMLHKENFTPILLATVGIITTLYAAFGVCGYLAFGDATEDVITLNFEGSSSMAMAVKLCLCIGLFFTYPVMIYPVFEVLLPTLSCGPSEGGSSRTSEVKSALLRSAIVLLTGVLAAGIPSFGGFISFIGSTCCSLLAFILPASFYLRLFPAEPPSLRARLHKLLLYTMILLGVAALVVGVYEAAASAMD